MPQAREIKRRISSVESTKQITRAMKMIAAAKLQRAESAMLAMRPYAGYILETIDHLAYELFGDEHPLFLARPEKRVATIVIAGDRGLCGGFNTSIVREALQHVASLPDAAHSVWSIGKRATLALRKVDGISISSSYEGVFDTLSYGLANEICEQLVDQFMRERIDAAYIVYNAFETVITPRPTVACVLPVDFAEILEARRRREREAAADEGGKAPVRPLWELEPDPETVMQRLISHLIATHVFQGTLESYAAELAARMTAMDNATKNAEDMITTLTMAFNRARQAGITSELLDIVGGAESLKQ